MDLEVRGAINVVEACGRTESIDKIVFSSSLTASIWRDNIGTQKDVDEKCWSDQDFCRNKKVSNLSLLYFRFYEFWLIKILIVICLSEIFVNTLDPQISSL